MTTESKYWPDRTTNSTKRVVRSIVWVLGLAISASYVAFLVIMLIRFAWDQPGWAGVIVFAIGLSLFVKWLSEDD